MQAITPALVALLKSHFQAGASGFRARIEVLGGRTPAMLASGQGGTDALGTSQELPSLSVAGDNVLLVAFVQNRPNAALSLPAGWSLRTQRDGIDPSGSLYGVIKYAMCDRLVLTGASPYHDTFSAVAPTRWGLAQIALRSTGSAPVASASAFAGPEDVTNPTLVAAITTPTAGNVLLAYTSVTTTALSTGEATFTWPDGWQELLHLPSLNTMIGTASVAYRIADGTETNVATTALQNHVSSQVLLVAEYPVVVVPGLTVTEGISRVSIDKSLRMQADQAEFGLANEGLPRGWGPSSVFKAGQLVEVYQWYGDEANAVRTFTGLVDKVVDHRDVLATTVTCRDRMALAIDQTFSASAPQGADEDGAVRTQANGVYLSMEVSDIVDDILDRIGWPAADRAITPTSYVLDEYVVSDGSSWADAIIGQDRLTGVTGYDAWADELGVFHFAPTPASDTVTVDAVPAYTFRSGEDVLALDDSADGYDLRTRVKVRGPLTTLKDCWTEVWRTDKLSLPVGLWYDPTDPSIIRVVDRGTRKLYRIRQSDQVVLGAADLSAVVGHPLGLSGDPSDATIYWALDAPWRTTGSTSGNYVRKLRKSDNLLLASYAIPNGRWSAIKVSAAYVYLTNLDTDRFYRRSKTDLTAVADYSHTYGGVTQLNPSGLMVDGTKLHLFWANGGTTARFLICDESAPTVITKVVATAGTNLHGGEMDTTTHIHCYGDSDSLGLVAKFTLAEPVENDVAVEVVDTALEDELGSLASTEPRTHDTHSGDAAHSWLARRETVDLTLITSLAQATETARMWLSKLARRRRVLDVGIVGNPALQKTDLVRVEDPVTGIAKDFIIDTYRSEMAADGTYVGTLALLRAGVANDVIDEDPAGA